MKVGYCMFKSGSFKLFLFPILVVALLAVFLIVVFTKGHPKTPATVAQVSSALEKNGFDAVDLTNDYQEKWNMDSVLKNAVVCEEDDLRFDFFVFDSEQNADYVRVKYQTHIRENRYANPNIEISEGATNYMLYTIKAKGVYTINMRVANTLVFAYCNEENANKLNAIMRELGYFDE